MTDFFRVLDPEHTGYLTPEAFSSFLEVNGFSATEDPCS
jgi:Ca2+-binding EF-hand superfamily protein